LAEAAGLAGAAAGLAAAALAGAALAAAGAGAGAVFFGAIYIENIKLFYISKNNNKHINLESSILISLDCI
jgi:hypothetical protein